MDRNRFLAAIIILLIVADSSNASFFWNIRKLIGVAPKDNSTTTQISPVPSPVSGAKGLNPRPVGAGKENPTDPQVKDNSSKTDPRGTNNSSKMDPKASKNNSTTGSVSPPTDKQIDKGKNHGGNEKGGSIINSQLVTNENCDRWPKRCRDKKNILACIPTHKNAGLKELVLLVQNEGESTLKVNLSVPISVDIAFQPFEIPKRQTRRVVLPNLGENAKILLDGGNGDCVLHIGPPESEGNFFLQFSFYYKQVTPIHGAYFLFLVVLIFGGIWGCCKLRKSRRHGEVPYQELEMGLPESASVVNVDTAEGWDQRWDDDWDEDKAVKSPGERHVGNISANGLTSRSSKRDGWENDWDD